NYSNHEDASVITRDNRIGFINEAERDIEPRLGETIEGLVIEVKPDGTLNVSLHPLKEDRIESDADIILAYLKINDGKMPYNDKSNPDDIKDVFGMSKSAFKRALGNLMRERIVNQDDSNTFLVK